MNNQDFKIRVAQRRDIPAMVALSYTKRRDYEKAQPQFWRYAEGAEEVQTKWFTELLTKDDHMLLVAKIDEQVAGFVIGRLMKAPEVYDPQGLTLMIDDFCIEENQKWQEVGGLLLAELRKLGKEQGASQVLVVCGAHDEPKRQFLRDLGLNVASEWYVGGIS